MRCACVPIAPSSRTVIRVMAATMIADQMACRGWSSKTAGELGSLPNERLDDIDRRGRLTGKTA